MFEDIPDFAQQMEILGLFNSVVNKTERYIEAIEQSAYESEHFMDRSDENYQLPEFDIQC